MKYILQMRRITAMHHLAHRILKKINHKRIYRKYWNYTMVPKSIYIENLELSGKIKNIKGCVVECGVWRGGMIAGIAEILGGKRVYYLFDSFEGLPVAQEIDGKAALAWQSDKQSPYYFDNCKAESDFANQAMQSSKVDFNIIRGWFADTLPNFILTESIALLRLDGDWYESTFECLTHLFPHVTQGGMIIIDDYYTWDGCARAVHDYLVKQARTERIRQSKHGVCYLIKEKD